MPKRKGGLYRKPNGANFTVKSKNKQPMRVHMHKLKFRELDKIIALLILFEVPDLYATEYSLYTTYIILRKSAEVNYIFQKLEINIRLLLPILFPIHFGELLRQQN